jgi:hypothetical protein
LPSIWNFGPGDLAALTAAFDVAWERLRVEGYIGDGEEIADCKSRLAMCILVAAEPKKIDTRKVAEAGIALFQLSTARRGIGLGDGKRKTPLSG